ncbi:MAG: hypothetical protein M3442_17885 [Chloroflexota bacterium]|nr:hypothetical protein [Chloroflexota bacterium]
MINPAMTEPLENKLNAAAQKQRRPEAAPTRSSADQKQRRPEAAPRTTK